MMRREPKSAADHFKLIELEAQAMACAFIGLCQALAEKGVLDQLTMHKARNFAQSMADKGLNKNNPDLNRYLNAVFSEAVQEPKK